MHFPEDVPTAVIAAWKHWDEYLRKYTDFSLKESSIHTYDHTSRVLFHALNIAYHLGIDEDGRDALAHAALFHDTRRLDDGKDVGHGARGAKNYESYCTTHEDLNFSDLAAMIMTFHDRDDAVGEKAIESRFGVSGVKLYRVFKDADGLDRVRLGNSALDPSFLRFQESQEMIDIAKSLLEESMAG